jgi:hypothetical protein
VRVSSADLLYSCLLYNDIKIKIYRTVILPVVLYGCETWSCKLRGQHRLRVFENRVLRKIFMSVRGRVIGEWRKLHAVELHDLYCSADSVWLIKSRKRLLRHVMSMGRREMHAGLWVGTRKK